MFEGRLEQGKREGFTTRGLVKEKVELGTRDERELEVEGKG